MDRFIKDLIEFNLNHKDRSAIAYAIGYIEGEIIVALQNLEKKKYTADEVIELLENLKKIYEQCQKG